MPDPLAISRYSEGGAEAGGNQCLVGLTSQRTAAGRHHFGQGFTLFPLGQLLGSLCPRGWIGVVFKRKLMQEIATMSLRNSCPTGNVSPSH